MTTSRTSKDVQIPDNDQDSILDVDDACPMEAEDFDNFEDEDGCPDTDNDQDGLLDAEAIDVLMMQVQKKPMDVPIRMKMELWTSTTNVQPNQASSNSTDVPIRM